MSGLFDELSDEELLSLCIGGGAKGVSALELSHNLLVAFGGLSNLPSFGYRSYMELRGMSLSRALSLSALMALSKRLSSGSLEKKPSLKGADLYRRYRALWAGEHRERLLLLELGRGGKLIREKTMYFGTESGVRYSEAEIIRELASSKASSFVMVHNHPSGLPVPSKGEMEQTAHLAGSCGKLGIRLEDHLIIGKEGYFSFLRQNEGGRKSTG